MGTSYSLTYDAENRLVGVSGGATASFVYDGDGQRVKATANGVTMVYIGDYYEQSGSTVKKYYYAAGQPVALRENGTLYWLLSDHLGSTAKVANGSTLTGELRYKAWGETRYTWGTTPTTYRFTGQREESTIGLYFYNARWYDPALGRFVQPDTEGFKPVLIPGGSPPWHCRSGASASTTWPVTKGTDCGPGCARSSWPFPSVWPRSTCCGTPIAAPGGWKKRHTRQ